MALKPVQITNWTPVGGVFKHVEYKLEINMEGAFWEVYRRYNDFAELDQNVRAQLGDVFCEKGSYKPTLPGKEMPYVSNKEVVDKRLPLLNTYLTDILEFDPPEEHKASIRNFIRFFLDMDNRGKSGVRMSLDNQRGKGATPTTVIRESFALISSPKTLNMLTHSCFIALASNKTLYICNNVYDPIERARHIIQLDSGRCTIAAVGKNAFRLTSGDEGFNFTFLNEHEAAHWMRAVGDASLSQTIQRSTETSRRAEQQRQQKEEEARAKTAQQALPTHHIKHGSVGGTTDALSSQFGV